MLEFMQNLSHEALLEMRALIWQLRPQGLEEGLAAALEKYAEVLGLQVNLQAQRCAPSAAFC